MMVPYFEDDRAWERFLRIIDSWEGTPYKHLGMTKGREADCTLFIGGCLIEAGILLRVEHDYYPRDWHVHTSQELILESFERHFRNHLAHGFTIAEVDAHAEGLYRGDVLVFSTVKTLVSNHAGIFLGDGRFANAINGRGFCYLKLRQGWIDQMTHSFRIMRGN